MSQLDTTAESEPFWEKGNLAPVHEEVTAFDLPVEGAIPPEWTVRPQRRQSA